MQHATLTSYRKTTEHAVLRKMSSPNLSTWQVCTGSGFEREITPLNFKEGSIELHPLRVLEGLSGLAVQMRFVSPDLTGEFTLLMSVRATTTKKGMWPPAICDPLSTAGFFPKAA